MRQGSACCYHWSACVIVSDRHRFFSLKTFFRRSTRVTLVSCFFAATPNHSASPRNILWRAGSNARVRTLMGHTTDDYFQPRVQWDPSGLFSYCNSSGDHDVHVHCLASGWVVVFSLTSPTKYCDRRFQFFSEFIFCVLSAFTVPSTGSPRRTTGYCCPGWRLLKFLLVV